MLYWALMFFVVALIAGVLGIHGRGDCGSRGCKTPVRRLPDSFCRLARGSSDRWRRSPVLELNWD